MQRVLEVGQCGPDVHELVGGKAAGLGSMLAMGLNVPPGFVVTTDAFRSSLAADLRREIDSRLAAARSPEEVREASVRIRELFTADHIGADLRADRLPPQPPDPPPSPCTISNKATPTMLMSPP